MKLVTKLFKKVVFSFGVLYAYNILMQQYNIPVPINIITIGVLTLFDFPGFIGLILFYLINFR